MAVLRKFGNTFLKILSVFPLQESPSGGIFIRSLPGRMSEAEGKFSSRPDEKAAAREPVGTRRVMAGDLAGRFLLLTFL
jgi:hypothetical protein